MTSGAVRFIATVANILALACKFGTPPPTSDIVVDFPGTTPADAPLLLYTGMLSDSCVTYQPNVANPTVTLHGVSYDTSCGVEVDAFAPGLGAFARVVDPLVPGDAEWLEAAIAAGSMSVTLPGLTTVPLQIWLVATLAVDVTRAEDMRDRLLDKAYAVLATMGTGLTLNTISAGLNPSLVPPNCNSADVIASNAAIYNASRINIYFVKDYANIPDLTPAYNCWQKSHPEIVFISWNNTHVVDPTLVHELGHALGLINPNAVGGHTYLVPGFNAFNLMSTNTDVTNVSIGQLYALNFSSSSWLNRPGSPLLKPVVRTCQNSWGTGPCPALTLFEPGWP